MKVASVSLYLLLISVLAATAGRAANNPISGVPLVTALNDAYELAGQRSDLKVVRVEGASMLPYFGTGAVLVVKQIPFAKLKTGMVVVYTNRFNLQVTHRLVSEAATGWTAAGYNNQAADSTPVSAENLVGVVYATFHSNGLPADAMASTTASLTPVALAGPAM